MTNNTIPAKYAIFRRQYRGDRVIGEYRIAVFSDAKPAAQRANTENAKAGKAENFYYRKMTDAEVLAYLPSHIRIKYQ
jgi:hypothetical protein